MVNFFMVLFVKDFESNKIKKLNMKYSEVELGYVKSIT